MTPNKPPLYLCDPEKNTECNKNTCAANPDAKYAVCDRTSKREYAATDKNGESIPAPPMDFHAPDIEEDDEEATTEVRRDPQQG